MFMVVVGTVDQLIDGLSFMTFVFYALCIVAVFILRVSHRKEPHLFKVWVMQLAEFFGYQKLAMTEALFGGCLRTRITGG